MPGTATRSSSPSSSRTRSTPCSSASTRSSAVPGRARRRRPPTDFVLDEWSLADARRSATPLIDAEIPHRWKGATVIVAADAEHDVDELLDAIEDGELLATGDGIEPPDGALGTMFVAGQARKDPLDADARTTLIDLGRQIDLKHPAGYGFAPRAWAGRAGVAAITDRSSPTARRRVECRRVRDDRAGPGTPFGRPPLRLTLDQRHLIAMLLAELEVWHTRPAVPTRDRARPHGAAGRPGTGFRWAAARLDRRRATSAGVARRLRPRHPPPDRSGRARRTDRAAAAPPPLPGRPARAGGEPHRLSATGRRRRRHLVRLPHVGTDLAQVLGRSTPSSGSPRTPPQIGPVLHKAGAWRGPIGSALIAHLAGSQTLALEALADPAAGRWDPRLRTGCASRRRNGDHRPVPHPDARRPPRPRRGDSWTRRRR